MARLQGKLPVRPRCGHWPGDWDGVGDSLMPTAPAAGQKTETEFVTGVPADGGRGSARNSSRIGIQVRIYLSRRRDTIAVVSYSLIKPLRMGKKDMPDDFTCRRCSSDTSYRAVVAELFGQNPETVFSRASIRERLKAGGDGCDICADNGKISLLLYHLRQDGIVEMIGRGRFRYRKSDDATTNFIYAGRALK